MDVGETANGKIIFRYNRPTLNSD